jgi:hypothetical protein
MSGKALHIASDESAPVPVSTTAPPFVFACRPRLSVRYPAMRTRISLVGGYVWGRSSDTLARGLDLMMQQMNH